MSKKQLSGVLASVLLLGLTACNNQDAALNPRNNDNMTNVVNRDNNRNHPFNVNNNSNLDGDHRGPLTKNNSNDFTNDWNNNPNRNGAPIISNFSTPMSSNEYPQTQSVPIQDARYQFLPVDPRQDTSFQTQLRQRYQGIIPGLEQQPEQQPLAQAPAQQYQQPNQAPAQQQQQPNQAPAKSQKPTAPANSSQAVQQVIDLTNVERKNNGLPALTADAKLNSVAQAKSSDMQQNNYFSHASPTYGSPFDMMRDQGVSYRSAGENIAKGQRTPQEVVQAWMNSEGHRRNILSSNYTHIGVGYDPNGHHWTQMFIEK